MILPKYPGTGYISRIIPKGGLEQEASNNAYESPYQFKFNGQLVNVGKSTTFDADATPTMVVAVPARTGLYVDGWVPVTTLAPDPRPGVGGQFKPYTDKLTATDSQSIAYAPDYMDWTEVTVAPMEVGTLIGVPVAANTSIVVGDEVAASDGGFLKKATSGNIVIGKCEVAGNNTGGVAGAKTATVKIGQFYTK